MHATDQPADDVDFFKRYNDCYGHLRGDICLKQVAATLQNLATRRAILWRATVGEEFQDRSCRHRYPSGKGRGAGYLQAIWDLRGTPT